VGVLDGVRGVVVDFKPRNTRRPLGAPSLVAGLLERDDGIYTETGLALERPR